MRTITLSINIDADGNYKDMDLNVDIYPLKYELIAAIEPTVKDMLDCMVILN